MRSFLCLALVLGPGCVTVAQRDPPPKTADPPPVKPPPPETPMSIAVRERAAHDFACDESQIKVTGEEERGTLQPGRERETWKATGCGQTAPYVAVCAVDEDGLKTCNAVVAEGNAQQMSPFGQ